MSPSVRLPTIPCPPHDGTRPLGESGPFAFLAADALTMKVRENGRVVNAVVLVATGVNADGHREILGIKVATSETHAAWNTFFADRPASNRPPDYADLASTEPQPCNGISDDIGIIRRSA